jgi:hypothetical protein
MMDWKTPQTRRRGVIVAGAATSAAVLLLLAVPYFLNVDHYRAGIESALSSSLGRQVEIGHLHFSLFTRTLTVDDVSISDDEAFGHSAFLHAKSLTVGVELLPLLFSHSVRVNSLALAEPQMHLLRSASGKWNYASLGARRKSGTAPPLIPDSSSGQASYSVQELRFTGGRVSIGSVPSGAAERSFASVSLVATHILPTSAFPVSIAWKAPGGGDVTLEGMVGPIEPLGKLEGTAIHMKFHGERVAIAGMEVLLQVLGIPPPPGASLRGGSLNADLAVDGPLGRMVATGPVALSNVEISGFNFATWVGGKASLGGIKNSPDTLIQSITYQIRVAPQQIRLDDLNVTLAGFGPITGVGTISPGNDLNFQMHAVLHAADGALGGLRAVASLGQGSSGIPFEIQGTTSQPVFVGHGTATVGNTMSLPFRGIGRMFERQKDEKKP